MTTSKILYQEETDIYAKYDHPGTDDFLEYKAKIQIKNSGKLPVVMKMKCDGMEPSFAPIPPEDHVFKAKDLMDLFLKLTRWFKKYGYNIK